MSDISDGELFEELENDFDMNGFRERRINQLKREINQRNASNEIVNHGGYKELTSEKDVLEIGLKEPKAVVHFFHPRFKRCEIMDDHLNLLAYTHQNTKFIKVNVENVPFLVEKLKIKVLPCVIIFKEGVAKERLIGFEDLGKSDKFETSLLEWKLFQFGAISKVSNNDDNNNKNNDEFDSDFDD